jgi:hypothetical protein
MLDSPREMPALDTNPDPDDGRAAGAGAPDPGDGDDLLGQAFYRDQNVADAESGAPTGGILRRLAPRVVVMVALLAVLDVVLRASLGPEVLLRHMAMEPASYLVKVARFAAAPAPDVLIMGSSRARDGFVPAVLAEKLKQQWGRPVSVYNLGLVNAKAEELYCLASGSMPDPAPERVILALTGSEIARAHNFQYAARFLWTWPHFMRYAKRTSWDDFRVEHVESYLESLVGRGWYLFGQRDALRHLLEAWVLERLGSEPRAGYNAADDIESFVTAPDGFHRSPPLPGAQNLAQRLRRNPDGIRLPPRELRRPTELTQGGRFVVLRETIAALQAQGSEVALVELPSSPYLQAKSPVQHGHVFRRRMAELAEELELIWVPYPAEANFLGNELYVDINHLTRLGAQRYSAGIYRKLRAKGFFGP